MNVPFPCNEFNQQQVIDYISENIVVDEMDESLSFGDIIIKQFDSYTGLESPDGRLISGHVVGFNDGRPLFVGLLKSGVDIHDAIENLQENLAERCKEFMFRKMMHDMLGVSDDDDE